MLYRYLLAVLAYVAPSMLLAVPWHLVWFKQEYHDFGLYTRADPLIPLGMASMFIQGAVMVWIYPRWYRGGRPLVEGVKFGLLFGLFLYSVSTVANIAKIEVQQPGSFILLSGIFHTMQFVAAGSLMGLAFGRLAIPVRTERG